MTFKLARPLPLNHLEWPLMTNLISGHNQKVTKKGTYDIGAIKWIRHLVPQGTLHLIYEALMRSHLDHCSLVWRTCGTTLRNKLQKLQNRAACVLTYSKHDIDAGHLFKLLKWKNLACQQNFQRATSLCTGWLQNISVLNSIGKRLHVI